MDINNIEQILYIALRFKPEYYGIHLTEGWANIDKLIYRINFLHGEDIINRSTLNKIVKNNPKFTLNTFKTKIKANIVGGIHLDSIKKTIPPDKVYYVNNGNVDKKVGILPMPGEKYVVMSPIFPASADPNKVLCIDTRKMFAAGYTFFITDNGCILTEKVTPKFIFMARR